MVYLIISFEQVILTAILPKLCYFIFISTENNILGFLIGIDYFQLTVDIYLKFKKHLKKKNLDGVYAELMT